MARFIEGFCYGNIDPQARSTKQNSDLIYSTAKTVERLFPSVFWKIRFASSSAASVKLSARAKINCLISETPNLGMPMHSISVPADNHWGYWS